MYPGSWTYSLSSNKFKPVGNILIHVYNLTASQFKFRIESLNPWIADLVKEEFIVIVMYIHICVCVSCVFLFKFCSMKINSYLKVIFHASSLLSCCYPVILVEFPPLALCIALQERERVARISCATFSCCFNLCPVLALSVTLSLAMQHKTINILWPFCWAHKSLEIDTYKSVCAVLCVSVCVCVASKAGRIAHCHIDTLRSCCSHICNIYFFVACPWECTVYTLPPLSTHPFYLPPPLFSQIL